ncbi:type II secretion system F family protein [Cohnella sp. GCM10020058]|uniref:type II secretion system F family protein n=1 Tax=Cohnella sp. GCM10020058 TaxID=3317330 RepID=UPI00362662CC
MMFLLIALCAVFSVLLWLAMKAIRKEKVADVLKLVTPQIGEEVHRQGFRKLINFDNPKERNWTIIVGCALAGGITALIIGGNTLLMAAAGGLIPYAVIKQSQYVYERRYRADGQAAIQFLHGIVAAGGSLEEWMLEVQPRLNGPLKAQFQHGYENYLRGVPITKFLESLIRNCPDSGLSLIFTGILREQRGAGDLMVFVNGALNDMQNQDRYIRVMAQVRKSGSQMLLYVFSFPIIFYALFNDSVDTTLDKNPVGNMILLIGIAGYLFLGWWGLRISRAKI